jgi:hypothetical protein
MNEGAGSIATYVYAVVPSDARPNVTQRGVDEADRVRTIVSGPVAALVSDVKAVPVPAERANLVAHSDVLQDAVQTSTVLPMRFGIVMPSDDAVRDDLLDARRAELEHLLSEVAGRAEMSVKAYYVEDALLASILTENPSIAQLRDETRRLPGDGGYYQRIRLGERIASAIDNRRARDSHQILDQLAPLAVRSVRDTPTAEQMLLKASFLVARDRIPEFRRLVGSLAERASPLIHFTCLGPLPPYSFVRFDAGSRALAATP